EMSSFRNRKDRNGSAVGTTARTDAARTTPTCCWSTIEAYSHRAMMMITTTIFRPTPVRSPVARAPAGSRRRGAGRIAPFRLSTPARIWNRIMNPRRAAACLLLSCALLSVIAPPAAAQNADVARVFSEQSPLEDPRLGPPRDTYDAYHPWVPPTTLPAWQQTD